MTSGRYPDDTFSTYSPPNTQFVSTYFNVGVVPKVFFGLFCSLSEQTRHIRDATDTKVIRTWVQEIQETCSTLN